MIIADEGLNQNLSKKLEAKGYSIKYVKDIQIGLADRAIIDIAKKTKGIILTEDKDFGEWVFSYHIKGLTVIFLRYDKVDYPAIESFLLNVLQEIEVSSEDKFIVISKNKIRIRDI